MLVFEKCQVSVSEGTSDILAEVLYDFPQNLHTNCGTVTQPEPRQIFSTPFATQYLLIILTLGAVQSELLLASLN